MADVLTRLDDLEQEMEALAAAASERGLESAFAPLKSRWDARVAEMRGSMSEARVVSGTAWPRVQEGFRDNVAELEAFVERARKELAHR